MKILVTVWLSALGTFGFTSIYILSNAQRINAPGELGECFFAIGITLAAILLFMTSVALTALAMRTRGAKK